MNAGIFSEVFFGNKVSVWAAGAGIAFGAYLALIVLRGVASKHLHRLAARTETDFDDFLADLLLRHTRQWFLAAISLYAGSLSLKFPAKAATSLKVVFLAAVAIQLGRWGTETIDYLIRSRASRDGEEQLNLEAYSVISWLAKGVMWSLVGLLVLNNMGVQVTALVAGLGVSGIAIALAIQRILGDLFASLSIVLDKPFVIGDPIMVGDMTGTVEHVGLKTTRVRAVGGEQIIFSNADLLATRISNFRRMEERRAIQPLGIVYQTPPEKVARIPALLREVVERTPRTRFERAHFRAFSPSSLDFELAYVVPDKDLGVFMDVQQEVNLGILRAFAGEGIEFAYPTRTVLISRDGEETRRHDP